MNSKWSCVQNHNQLAQTRVSRTMRHELINHHISPGAQQPQPTRSRPLTHRVWTSGQRREAPRNTCDLAAESHMTQGPLAEPGASQPAARSPHPLRDRTLFSLSSNPRSTCRHSNIKRLRAYENAVSPLTWGNRRRNDAGSRKRGCCMHSKHT